MSFTILEHLDELTILEDSTTWMRAVCPICKEAKLKINKHSGAYSCYANDCQGHDLETNEIRNLLNRFTPFRSNVFSSTARKQLNLTTKIDEKHLTVPISSFKTNISYVKPKQKRYKDKLYTKFEYSVDFRYYRCDTNKGKFFIPSYKGKKELPPLISTDSVYQSKYLQSSIVIAEGEKSASACQYLGLAGVSFLSALYNQNYLNRFLHTLFSNGVKAAIILADNDAVGLTKSTKTKEYCWNNNIEADVLNLTDIFTEYINYTGFDIYDALQEQLVNRNNIFSVLEHVYNNTTKTRRINN